MLRMEPLHAARGAMNAIAYVNGEFLPLAEARVPVLDRGFLFADSVYEVIPVYGAKPFTLAEHLQRLERSLAEVRITNPHTREQWSALVERLIQENRSDGDARDQMVYLQVTRGASSGRSHAFPENVKPTVVGLCSAMPNHGATALRDGVSAVTRPDIRWGRCDIKSTALLPNILASQAAREQGCNETILHRDGRITEGASSNVFAVIGGSVVTTPKGPEILTGITRAVLDLLRAAGINTRERTMTLEELRGAQEIWITSATREVLPVTRLDGRPVGDGKPGALWRKAHALFQDFKRRA